MSLQPNAASHEHPPSSTYTFVPPDSSSTHAKCHGSEEATSGSSSNPPFAPISQSESRGSFWRLAQVKVLWAALRNRFPKGWRFGATLGAITALCVLVMNTAVVVVGSTAIKGSKDKNSSIASIRHGTCSDIKQLGLGIHLVINIMSTLLFGASNYCMQCLSAPTRADIDKAHRRGVWLDVGILSVRNFFFVRPLNVVLWLLLGISSIPLHLLYNSTFFTAITNHPYPIYFVSDDFATGGWIDSASFHRRSLFDHRTDPYLVQSRAGDLGRLINGSTFERLENSDCIEAYAKTPLPDRRTLILVSRTAPTGYNFRDGISISKAKNTSLYALYYYEGFLGLKGDMGSPFSWLCPRLEIVGRVECNRTALQEIRSDATRWNVWGSRVEYCISEKIEHQCDLYVATNLLAVVIVCNAIKVLIIGSVAIHFNNKPLITIGDAAASFIRNPDSTTQKMCLLEKADLSTRVLRSKRSIHDSLPRPKSYKAEQRRPVQAVSDFRWLITMAFTLVGIAAPFSLMSYAMFYFTSESLQEIAKSIWNIGLGTANPLTIVEDWRIPSSDEGAIIATILLANLPQGLLSMLYILINSIFTNVAIAEEWSRYAHHKRGLRVSEPSGEQRSTYFLQLPYRIGLPLMAFSSFLHWIVSQSFFAIKIDAPQSYVKDLHPSVISCAYSPLGIIISIITVITVFAFTVTFGSRKLISGLPLAGSCSAAISAACHAPEGTFEYLPVKGGVIPGEETQTVGHCAFSNNLVEPPVEGHLYE